MSAIRQCIRKMTGYVPGESPKNPDTVKLNQNENRYPPSPAVARAITEAIGSLELYPDSTSVEVRRAASEVYGVAPERVMATNGSDEMLRILFQTCCDPGDTVVAFYPSYTYYETLAAMHDVNYRLIDFEGEYAIPARLDLAGAKLVFLPNPNAPTGTVFPESEVRRLIEAVPDGLVVLDEAYADFCGQTAIPLIDDYPNLVVARTFSKSYALAGLRLGLGFAREELLAEMEKVRDYYNLDRLAQAGGAAALRDTAWLAETAGRIIATRQRTIESLRSLGLKVYDSGANFFMIRFAGPEEAKRVFDGLRRRDVYVRYFNSRGIADCLRVSVGTDGDMDVFLEKIAEVVRK